MKPVIKYGWWWDIKCRCCVSKREYSYAKRLYRRAVRRFLKQKDEE